MDRDRIAAIKEAALQLALRTVPLLPANELFALITAATKNQKNVDAQIQEAVEALSRSSDLIDNLGETLKEREKKLREMQKEYEKVSQLASLTAAQGEAVAASLAQVLGRTQTKERWVAFGINIVAGLLLFVLGVFASDWVKEVPKKFGGQQNVIEQKAP